MTDYTPSEDVTRMTAEDIAAAGQALHLEAAYWYRVAADFALSEDFYDNGGPDRFDTLRRLGDNASTRAEKFDRCTEGAQALEDLNIVLG